MPRHRTLAEPFRFEPDPIKASRFIAHVAPARDEDAAQAFVESVRAAMPDARHHCFAWRLGTDDAIRSSDDGEPGGSAGRPILAQIAGHDLHHVVVVVTRYFGGTKLGVGGLMRAYGGAAGKALDRATIQEVEEMTSVFVEHGYDDTNAVHNTLSNLGLAVLNTEYGEGACLEVEVAVDKADELRRELTDRTAGRVRFS